MSADHNKHNPSELPEILCGPILRHVSSEQLVVWLVTAEADPLVLECYQDDTRLQSTAFKPGHSGYVRLGKHAHLHLLVMEPEQSLPQDEWLSYDVGVLRDSEARWLRQTLPDLHYGDAQRPDFIIKSHIDHILHGSCRKPHHKERDGLLRADEVLEAARGADVKQSEQPALLMMSGDQIYADDVAGPMLEAIQQVIELLELVDEDIPGIADLQNRRDLQNSVCNFYRRTELLPDTKANATVREAFFGGARKPVFTSVNADNHLITLAEVLAMYLLVWSPVLWRFVDVEQVNLPEPCHERYQRELEPINVFADGLDKVQRVLAHVPVYMIFDDHDVTDDWNLTRGWEESAYGQPFSCRIIGNAMIAYLLCQAWGNAPGNFPQTLLDQLREALETESAKHHDELIYSLRRFEGWQYTLDTKPRLVVLDTRTRRWRSETGTSQPSGLMDWASLIEMQQELIDQQAVILVSPAPIFGVKLIEVVQRIFTWFGQALAVDAENWMAHPGSANVILNIFRHQRTPHNFVILSGDVHYSFAYDVRLRGREESPHIWQITSSGIKATFPEKLLRSFDRLNRWLFASYSPLNLFTRRRSMHIRSRRPAEHDGRYRHQRLLNGNGIGRVRFNESGEPVVIETLWMDGQEIAFKEGYDWDWH
ncbi:MAG: alkaline phosphatase D family protein [Thiolinea sp.]